MHDLNKDEQARRKDITQEGVAQEALDTLETINTVSGSSSDVFIEHGYSLSHVLKPAIVERVRVVSELKQKPSKDVESNILDVAAVKVQFSIPEFDESTKSVELIPE